MLARAAAAAAGRARRRSLPVLARAADAALSSTSAPLPPPPPPPPPPPQPLDLKDTRLAFAHASSGQLLRAWLVLSACRIRPLVSHAEGLISLSRRLLGGRATDALLRSSFFAHFCGGEDEAGAAATVARLRAAGVGAILDYAAEAEAEAGGGEAPAPSASTPPTDPVSAAAAPPARAVGRTFAYQAEAVCDGHAATFRAAIKAAAAGQTSPSPSLPGFAALKLTALGDPRLLVRVSACLRAVESLFSTFDADGDGLISRDEFSRTYTRLFSDGSPARLDDLFSYLDPLKTGSIDFLSWSARVRLRDVPAIVRFCREPGPLAAASLTEEELKLLDAALGRLRALANAAAASGVRLFVDAEQDAVQPAIAAAARALQREFNGPDGPGFPVIFTTVQAYLKASPAALELDLRRSKAEGWAWAGKIVRGAYLEHERAVAASSGAPCPVWETRAETDEAYGACAALAIDAALAGPSGEDGVPGPEVMLATHNRGSVADAVACVAAAGRAPHRGGDGEDANDPLPVYFGQLLGMADGLTFNLAAHGWPAYKYVPYGHVSTVLPYLVRRARENAGALPGGSDVGAIERELGRRFAARLFVPTRVARATGGAWQ
jgi:proline dehydrogenase